MRKLLPFILALCLIVSGCSSSGGSSDRLAQDSMASADNSSSPSYGLTVDGSMDAADSDTANHSESSSANEEELNSAPEETQNNSTTNPDLANSKLIYSASIEMEATDFEAAQKGLRDLVNSLGGFFESTNHENYDTIRTSYYVVRIPSEQYQAFIDSCNKWENCKVLRMSEQVEEIGAEYLETETILEMLQTKLGRLGDLLEQAEQMEDIITIEGAITETEYQIRQYSGELNYYDNLIDYATINIDLTEVLDLTEDEEIFFGARLIQNLRWGLENFVDGVEVLLLGVAYNLPGLVILAIVIFVIVKRKKIKKKSYSMMQTKSDTNTDMPNQDKPI